MQEPAGESTKGPEALLPAGTLFGKYQIVRSIGVGGMGGVYEATHTLLKKPVALKTLHALLATHGEHRTRFLREGEAVARIRHPNVVDVSDVGVQDGIPFLVMELLHGENLHDLLRREAPLDEKRMASLMVPVAAGLAAAHAAGVVHRDLKPENIFLARDGKGDVRPKLLDFGISKMNDTEAGFGVTGTGALLGTPYYMAPEQAQGGAPVDARCDQYALGVMLYECATGRLPFFQERLLDLLNAISQGVFLEPRVLRPELEADFENVILRAMATSPDSRFETVEDFGRALLPYASSRVRAEYGPSLGVRIESASSAPPPMRTSSSDVARQSGSTSGARRRSGADVSRSSQDSTRPTTTGGRTPTPAAHVLGIAATERPTPTPTPERPAAERPPGRLGLIVGALVLLVVLVGGGGLVLSSHHGTPETTPAVGRPPVPTGATPAQEPTTFAIAVDTVPLTATIALDGVQTATGRLSTTLTRDGRYHTLHVSAPGFEPRDVHFHDALPDGHIALDASPVQVAPPPTTDMHPPPEATHGPRHPHTPHGDAVPPPPGGHGPPDDIRLNR